MSTMTTDHSSFDLSLRVYEDAAEVFGLLSSPCRLRIVDALCTGEKNVGQLLALIPASQSNMSQHLTVLYRSGLLAKRRSGVQVYYRIAEPMQELVCEVVQSQLHADGAR
jgi:DNA-binding transcriptional ArsR family regulator